MTPNVCHCLELEQGVHSLPATTRCRLPQLQAVRRCIGGAALLAVVDTFTHMVPSLATASSGTRLLGGIKQLIAETDY